MINADGATIFFSTHLKGNIWTMTPESSQAAAIAQARMILSRALGRAMNDSEATYAEGDQTRDEYAVYEQALYLIENGTIANAQGSAPQPILVGATDAPDIPRNGISALYAPEALRWLGYTGAVVVKG